LSHHRIVYYSRKSFNFEGAPYPFEKEFDPPTLFVQLGNGLCIQMACVGDKREFLAGFRILNKPGETDLVGSAPFAGNYPNRKGLYPEDSRKRSAVQHHAQVQVRERRDLPLARTTDDDPSEGVERRMLHDHSENQLAFVHPMHPRWLSSQGCKPGYRRPGR
jgi:hypothetical protein